MTEKLKKRPNLFVGIDLGSQGVRLVVVTETGKVVLWRSVPLDAEDLVTESGIHEQNPTAWWNAVCQATSGLVDELKTIGYETKCLTALAVDGTSGSLVAVDSHGRAVRPAIMYNDPRSAAEADEINSLPQVKAFCESLGYRFASSFSLAKIIWLRKNEPDVFARTDYLIHQADYITGHLTGDFAVSDYSNALKTGYDLVNECWPEWLDNWDGVAEKLGRIIAPSSLLGRVTTKAAGRTGLPAGLPVIAGASDGTAGFFASGAKKPGDYNTTLGTTLVFKGISRKLCRHKDGLIYCHKLSNDFWLPGAASNTGGEWIAAFFGRKDLKTLDAAAKDRLPCEYVAYPLMRKTERFPFSSAKARRFCVPQTDQSDDLYAAYLQGTAFVERLSCRVLDDAAGTSGGDIFSTGGGSRSNVWMQCRADVTGRTIHRPACPEAAFGSAVLAAGGTFYSDVREAIEKMTDVETTFKPNLDFADKYDKLFDRFCAEIKIRGYF